MNRVHDLKITEEYFNAKLKGLKPWELRLDDRGFSVGDTLRLREVRVASEPPYLLEYTGRIIIAEIIYILRGGKGLWDGYVVMSERIDIVLE
jgi:hypothetical protein